MHGHGHGMVVCESKWTLVLRAWPWFLSRYVSFLLYSWPRTLPWPSLRRLRGLLTRWAEKPILSRVAVESRTLRRAFRAVEPRHRFVLSGLGRLFFGPRGMSNPPSTNPKTNIRWSERAKEKLKRKRAREKKIRKRKRGRSKSLAREKRAIVLHI